MKDKQKSIPLEIETTVVSSKKTIEASSLYEKPTPLDFDAFVPWICLQWQSPNTVAVTKMLQEEYTKRHSSSSRSKTPKSLKFKHDEPTSSPEDTKKSATTTGPSVVTDTVTVDKTSIDNSTVPVKAYYDIKGNLVEISIADYPFNIHRKVIQAFTICVPFHSLLTKLSIRNSGVTVDMLREIGKMLIHSNLTDICLDDCIVPGGKFEVLLERSSSLKYLSLNRCSIDDEMCNNLAAHIHFGGTGCSLLILELGSNLISDVGAIALGESLRTNRNLLHLNLSGNIINDAGALAILSHLMEFQLTWNEVFAVRHRKFKYTERKREVYAICYEEVLKRQKEDLQTSISSIRKPSKAKSMKNMKDEKNKKQRKSTSVFVQEKSAIDIAHTNTINIVGQFIDPYDDSSIVTRDKYSHSKGNMVLCSLNLSYNNLSYFSIQKIYEVSKYQDQMDKHSGATGLLRMVFNGNYIPVHCIEYDRIEMFLKKAVNQNSKTQTTSKKRTLSSSASKRF